MGGRAMELSEYGHRAGYGDGPGYGDGHGYGHGHMHGGGYGHGRGYGCVLGNGNGDGYGEGEVDVPHSSPVICWHYVNEDGSLRYSHDGVTHVTVGSVLECDPDEVVLCLHGLHASMTPKEAAQFHLGTLCKVAVSGRVVWGLDKLAGSRRVVLEMEKP